MFFNLFKKPKEIKPHHREELLRIIEMVKSTVHPETELIYSYFESVDELLKELDELSEEVKKGELNSLNTLSMHFAPTSGFQELSMQNGWSKEYLKLADQFDSIHNKYK
ncbi:hypothetical protein [Fluviicola taffensis]|uniref:hypothetical protein n=1 Tax=Fluviicola taffensis TaxID=191579 RepID=UPI003138481A